MPENEFEKKVSSELQLLKFKPSEAVWMRVEERIRKKNKRRVFIILFLLAGIALLGYWQWDNLFGDKNGDIVKTETPVQEKNEMVTDNDQNTRNDANDGNQTQQLKPVEKSEDDKKDVSKNKPTSKTDNKTSQNTVSRQIGIDSKKVAPTEQEKRIPRNDKKDLQPDQKGQDVLTAKDPSTVTIVDARTITDSTKIMPAVTDNVNQDLNQNIAPITKVDSVRPDTLVRKDLINKDTATKKIDSVLKTIPADSPVVNIQKKPVNKKWKFGIEFIPGSSSLKEDFFSFSMNKSADLYASPGSGSGTVVPAGPVKSESAFAFQFGGFLKRSLTKRSGLSVGLRWAYYTEDMRIGARMIPATASPAFLQLLDALGVSSANAANGTFYQVNKYHFIELPVNYIVQLNKSVAHPITLNAGLKVGRMFTSDAVVYDTAAGGIYYSSRKHFNKTQLGLSSSLNWKVTKKDKFYFAIGPVLDMHLNSLLDNPYDSKKYLLFVGLRSSMIFNLKE